MSQISNGRPLSFVWLALLPILLSSAVSAHPLNPADFGLGSSRTGVCAIGADSGAVYAEHQPTVALVPASVQKLLVAAVALKELGPQSKAETQIFLRGKLSPAGEIDLLAVKAGVDPTFTIERLYLLARSIRALGVSKARKLVLDDTALVDPRDRLSARAYAGAISAFNLNWNTFTARACGVSEEVIGSRVPVTLDPFEAGFKVASSVRIGKQDGITAAASESGSVQVSGFASRGECAEDYGSVPDARVYTSAVFQSVLAQVGIQVDKQSVVFGAIPLDAVPAGVFDGEPLEDVVRAMNYFSNNMMADLLAARLGRGDDGRFSRARGVAAVEAQVRALVSPEMRQGLALQDGSGLSPSNKLPVSALCRVLQATYHDKSIRDVFFASLPQHGVSGTMKRRLEDTPGRSKTGSLSTVSSLAGLVYGAREPILFAVIQNEVKDLARAKANEDRLVTALARSER